MTNGDYSLVGDIGGTHARFALVRSGKVLPEAVEVLACGDYQNVDAAVADYLERSGVGSAKEACFAVASSMRGPRVEMTNNHWHFDSEAIRNRFGWHRIKVINDFTAMALGIPHVTADKLIPVCGGPGDATRPRLVIGPGTGLGVSGLVPSGHGWLPLTTEGGHVEFAPTDDTEMAILTLLQARYGHVSAERVLSGQGLLNLYQAHARIQRMATSLETPEQITTAALDRSDPLAHRALQHFCEILGRVAGNAALTLGATGGVYLCGGILPGIIDFFLDSGFQEAFEDKGRRRILMESTPVYLVTERYTGLLGAASALISPEN